MTLRTFTGYDSRWTWIEEHGYVSVYFEEVHAHTDYSRRDAETWVRLHHHEYESPVTF